MAVKRSAEKKAPAPKRASVTFARLQAKRAFEEISAEIKRIIFSGVLKPGDILPSELQLAGQFGVSRQTVREALRRLEASGFIATQKGASGGPVVVDTILKSMSDLFLDAFLVKKVTTEELTRARLDIEKMVLKNVFQVKDREKIALIRQTLEETQKLFRQGSDEFEGNIRFHKLLAEATGNHVFIILMESLMAVVAHFHSVLKIDISSMKKACRAHFSILDAIEKEDEPRAQAGLEKDILDIYRVYKRSEETH
ncbi:MAG: FadR family transcriptional regulator [Desulfobacteraceae bacterium]|nr:MAG: FadR family transcriptional regulator [Desulfobacteraceae bacterium]